MKLIRLFTLFALALGLLTATSHALAQPVSPLPHAQATVSPDARATEKAARFATLQAAQNPGKAEHLVGKVGALDASSMTLVLPQGLQVPLLLSPNLRVVTLDITERLRPATLEVGQSVLVRALRNDNGLTARIVLVRPNQPVRAHITGVVTNYTPGASIAIRTADGMQYAFVITPSTEILPENLASMLGTGSRVTILVARDSLGGQNTAFGVAVLSVGP